MVQLYGQRFVYNTFLTMQQLAMFIALQDGSVGAGTAGQVPYYAAAGNALTAEGPFAAGSSIIGAGTSGLLSVGPFTAGLPIIGNGAGGLAAGTKSGTTNQFATVGATPVSGQCVVWLSAGDQGSVDCTPSGSGNVSAGTVGQLAAYTATTTVAGTTTGTGVLTALGHAVNTTGGVATLPLTVSCTLADTIGFVGNSSTANDTAWTNWVNSLPSNGGCIQFGAGTYVFTGATQTAITMGSGAAASVSIFGLGSNLTFLKYTNASIADAILFEYGIVIRSSFHIRDLSVQTTHVGLGNAIEADNTTGNEDDNAPPSDITNVIIEGSDFHSNPGTSTQCWNSAITTLAVSNIAVINTTTNGSWGAPGSAGCGIGLYVDGDHTHATYSTLINVVSSSFNYHANAWQLNGYWQGVSCTLCNFNGEEGTTCINIPPSQPGVLVLLNINNSQLNCKGAQILVGTITFNVMVNNSVLSPYGNNGVGIDGALYQSSISGNQINNTQGFTGQNGVAITSGSTAGMITGNTFVGLSGGIIYNSGASNWNNQSNTYSGVTVPVVNNCGASCKSGGGSP